MRQLVGHREPGGKTAVSQAILLFVVVRLVLTGWAGLIMWRFPPPTEANEGLRPYLDEPQLTTGLPGWLLGPWQRFDTQHYLRLARQGYTAAEDSVFPPLYPLLIRGLAAVGGGGPTARLLAALLLSNGAALGLFITLGRLATAELGEAHAGRTILYLALFPTGFFLFAGYSESLFLWLVLLAWMAGRNGRFHTAGLWGALAALTRLTGWVLVLPLAYQIGQRHGGWRNWPRWLWRLWPAALPGLALVAFLVYRAWLGLPPLAQVYAQFWYQTTGLPGQDLLTAGQTLFGGGPVRRNEIIALSLDFAATGLLLLTTILAYRRLGVSYGLYATLLLLFMLLPTSPVKPLYSFSRYALTFFPTFMLLAQAGKRPWLHRLILYTCLLLYLFYSGQFFLWGWVA